jgi:hypothetical protein
VAKLIAIGWIRRDSYGHLFITEKPYEHFIATFNIEGLKELCYIGACMQKILDSGRRIAENGNFPTLTLVGGKNIDNRPRRRPRSRCRSLRRT